MVGVSKFTGSQGRGAARTLRETKRAAAEQRAAATDPTRRRAYRHTECPTGKRKYDTDRDARVGAVVGRNRGRNHRRETRIYVCPACGGWHLTSAPERTTERTAS
ncbi:MAG: hypothetical protein ACRCYU_08490 [Nocardioides sp.]